MVVCPKGMKIKREEFVKVILQALHSLGYPYTAQHLNTTWGFLYIYQPIKFENLRTQSVNGFREQCAETLCSIEGLDQEIGSRVTFLNFYQWVTERLALNPYLSMSAVLQNKDASRQREGHLKRITTLMENFNEQMISDYINGLNNLTCVVTLRKLRLKRLDAKLAPEVAMFDNRLSALVGSAHSAQIYSCLSHNEDGGISDLYKDHSCDAVQLPTNSLQVLTGHTDAVWYAEISHSVQYLASASCDHTAIMWEILDTWQGLISITFVLRGHSAPVSCVSWSFNDELLPTCASGEVLRVWDVRRGACIHVISEGEPFLGSCAFLSGQLDIVYGTLKPPRSIFHLFLNEDAEQMLCSGTGESLMVDFAITPNGSKLIIIYPEGTIVILDIHTKREDIIIEEAASVSEDCKSLIINLSNHRIHVWHLSMIKAGPSTYCGRR